MEGSSHRSRKRPRENRDDTDMVSREATPAQEDQSETTSRNGIVSSRDSDSKKSHETGSSNRKPGHSSDTPGNECNARRDSLNIHDLSFILHPSHEVSTSEKDAASVCSPPESEKSMMLARACYALNLTADVLERM